jgi:hypothetical protein
VRFTNATFTASGTSTVMLNDYMYTEISVSGGMKDGHGITPELYFKYVKKKLQVLISAKFENRMKKLEKAWNKAVENGQIQLSEKILAMITKHTKESYLLAKGYKFYIPKEVLNKNKYKIKDGHISDTRLKDYTRHIPPEVIKKKKEVENLFNDFVIYHYWNENQEDVKNMTPDEKQKMKDPILFGIINEAPENLYFIADWIDEYCDLTLNEIIDVLDLEEEDCVIPKEPILELD